MQPLRRARTGLKRRVVVGKIHIDGPHLDAVLARVAYDLRGRVETERLAVQEPGREDVGIAAFQPGRRIDEQCEARGMTFRETVFAEALDLAEAALGEFLLIAALDHSLDQLVAERADGADAAEGGHGAA